MFSINGNVISLTRGDSAYITLRINGGGENAYKLESGDTVSCQVRPGVNTDELLFDGTPQLEWKVGGTDILWHIRPQDTNDADPNMEYYWDAQLTLSNGDVFTFIPASRFKILDEVTLS